jgi:hypothetical protein
MIATAESGNAAVSMAKAAPIQMTRRATRRQLFFVPPTSVTVTSTTSTWVTITFTGPRCALTGTTTWFLVVGPSSIPKSPSFAALP